MKIVSSLTKKVAALGCFVSLFAATSAYAALPGGVATFFSGISADFSDLLDTYMYPLMLVVTAGFIIMRLVKRGAKAAT